MNIQLRQLEVVAAIFALTLAAPLWAAQPVNQRVDADPKGSVDVNSTSGSIHCIGWDKPEVEVSGKLGSSAERVDVQKSGNTISVHVVARSGSHWGEDTELEIKLPASSALAVSVVSADVTVVGVTGQQRLQSVSGDIQSGAAGADLIVKSLSGDIKIQGKSLVAHTTVSTVSGNAHLQALGGDLELDTVSGDVDAEMSTLERGRIKSISGDIALRAGLGAQSRIEVSSVSGDLHLRWLGADKANINVESFSGDISSCFGGVAVERSKSKSGSAWHYSHPGSGADAHVKTMSGDVIVCDK